MRDQDRLGQPVLLPLQPETGKDLIASVTLAGLGLLRSPARRFHRVGGTNVAGTYSAAKIPTVTPYEIQMLEIPATPQPGRPQTGSR